MICTIKNTGERKNMPVDALAVMAVLREHGWEVDRVGLEAAQAVVEAAGSALNISDSPHQTSCLATGPSNPLRTEKIYAVEGEAGTPGDPGWWSRANIQRLAAKSGKWSCVVPGFPGSVAATAEARECLDGLMTMVLQYHITEVSHSGFRVIVWETSWKVPKPWQFMVIGVGRVHRFGLKAHGWKTMGSALERGCRYAERVQAEINDV